MPETGQPDGYYCFYCIAAITDTTTTTIFTTTLPPPPPLSSQGSSYFFKIIYSQSFTLKKLFIFNWRIIALQYRVGFCHTMGFPSCASGKESAC